VKEAKGDTNLIGQVGVCLCGGEAAGAGAAAAAENAVVGSAGAHGASLCYQLLCM
jgi:hypothetical protein